MPDSAGLLAALFFDQGLELALHGFKGVANYFTQRLVHLVRGRAFVGHQLVARRHGEIDPHSERVTGVLGMVWMLDDNVAAADVIAETIEPRRFAPDELLELIRFFHTTIGNFNR